MLHSGRPRPYPQPLDYAGKACQGQTLNFIGAVVKGRRDKGRWTKGRRGHKVDIAPESQKADDRRLTGMVKETKCRQYKH